MPPRATPTHPGVPRETRARHSLPAWADALAAAAPDVNRTRAIAHVEQAGYFDAGMQSQLRLLAHEAVALAKAAGFPSDVVFEAFCVSLVERIRGVAALVIEDVHADDLEAALLRLRRAGALPGTWPRELAQMVLHGLVIGHGATRVKSAVLPWLHDPNEAVRRMVVEGFRPRGVMIPPIRELIDDPGPCRDILAAVLDDPADYVRHAAANHLNDISRDNADTALAWATDWLHDEPADTVDETAVGHRRWVIERGLRTLVKAGDRRALALFDYIDPGLLTVRWDSPPPSRVELNERIPLAVKLTNPTAKPARVILFAHLDMPGRGAARRRAAYQLWKGQLAPGETRVAGKHVLFANKTTQPKEPGEYIIAITLNGVTSLDSVFHFADR